MEHHGQLTPLIFHFVNFAILAGLFVYMVRKKGAASLHEAKLQAEGDIIRAKERLDRADADLRAARSEESALPSRINELRGATEASADLESRRIVEGSRQTADYLLREGTQAAGHLVSQSVDKVYQDIAGTVASRVREDLSKRMTPDDHQRVEQHFLRNLPKARELRWTS